MLCLLSLTDIAGLKTRDACQKVKANVPVYVPPERPALYHPMAHVHLDLFGPIDKIMADPPSGKRYSSHVYVAVMVDYFTKVAEVVPV